MNDLFKLEQYIRENFKNAELLKVSHTETIFYQSDDNKESAKCPIKEGLIVLFDNEV